MASGLSVTESAEYRAASAQFARGDVSGALAAVARLEKDPSLSAEDRTFLDRQAAICRARLSGKAVAVSSPATLPSATVRPSIPASVAASSADCGPRALLLVCERLHVPASLPALRKAAGTTGAGTNLAGLIQAARSVGLTAEGVQMDGPALANVDRPALAWTDGNHFIAVLAVHGDTATIHDPNHTGEEDISLTAGPTGLLARSGGILVLLSRGKTIALRISQRMSTGALAVNTAGGM